MRGECAEERERRASSKGAKPVPYRRMPRTGPRACLKAEPSAMAESCRGKWARDRHAGEMELICRVVVVYPEIALALEGE